MWVGVMGIGGANAGVDGEVTLDTGDERAVIITLQDLHSSPVCNIHSKEEATAPPKLSESEEQ